jgi:g-D-glutamyl-meso-diaminopimelate peptidase
MLRVKTLGKSVVGRSIYGLEIGKESAPPILFAGTFLGTDRYSGKLLLQFAEAFLCAITKRHHLAGIDPFLILRHRKLMIVPFMNPDGREICARGAHCGGIDSGRVVRLSGGNTRCWDANARGVEIPRNFIAANPSAHGVYGPAPWGYSGPTPESEPETAALCNLCRTVSIRHAIAFHSQGEVIYAPSGNNIPKRSERMAEIMAASSGYALEQPEGLAVGGGFKDWFIKEFDRPAFTVEVGNGQNPLPIEDYPKIYADIREMLMLCAIM